MTAAEMAAWIDRAMPWLIRMRDEYVDLIRHSEPEGCEPFALAIADLDSLMRSRGLPSGLRLNGEVGSGRFPAVQEVKQ